VPFLPVFVITDPKNVSQANSRLGSPAAAGINAARLLGHPVVASIAHRLQRTPAQVAFRWGLQMGQSVLPKSTDEARIMENLDVFGWCIPEELMARMSEIQQVIGRTKLFIYLFSDVLVYATLLMLLLNDRWLKECSGLPVVG
jgi:diketogulonate reductase-like aldo/keto reductase